MEQMIYQSWCVLCIDKTINTDGNEDSSKRDRAGKTANSGKIVQMKQTHKLFV